MNHASSKLAAFIALSAIAAALGSAPAAAHGITDPFPPPIPPPSHYCALDKPCTLVCVRGAEDDDPDAAAVASAMGSSDGEREERVNLPHWEWWHGTPGDVKFDKRLAKRHAWYLGEFLWSYICAPFQVEFPFTADLGNPYEPHR